ncbi:hypothetical protein AB0469_33535 [Streptomyces sp. NPDC093801]|uniref:hypothetical protein n=1 Tax=Streptomyces sp. NPDC093801 TaxID=3155203 RepID=UPI00344E39E7
MWAGRRRARHDRGFRHLGPDGRPLAEPARERVRALAIPPAREDVRICPGRTATSTWASRVRRPPEDFVFRSGET